MNTRSTQARLYGSTFIQAGAVAGLSVLTREAVQSATKRMVDGLTFLPLNFLHAVQSTLEQLHEVGVLYALTTVASAPLLSFLKTSVAKYGPVTTLTALVLVMTTVNYANELTYDLSSDWCSTNKHKLCKVIKPMLKFHAVSMRAFANVLAHSIPAS